IKSQIFIHMKDIHNHLISEIFGRGQIYSVYTGIGWALFCGSMDLIVGVFVLVRGDVSRLLDKLFPSCLTLSTSILVESLLVGSSVLSVISESGVDSIGLGLGCRVDSGRFQLGQLLDDDVELVLHRVLGLASAVLGHFDKHLLGLGESCLLLGAGDFGEGDSGDCSSDALGVDDACVLEPLVEVLPRHFGRRGGTELGEGLPFGLDVLGVPVELVLGLVGCCSSGHLVAGFGIGGYGSLRISIDKSMT
ncbi:hypothetical protein PMAYCL1PPCAC_21930, partial [Pristionchus mayeri]